MTPGPRDGGGARPTRAPEPLRQSAQRRSAQRALSLSIAVTILVVFSLSGLIYRQLWQATGQDLTRLLPGTVLAYATAPTPWATLRRAAALERWRSPETLAAALDTQTYLDASGDAELGGVPVDIITETVRAADEVSFAVIPTESGPAALAFVEIREPRKRKLIQSRLAPLLEPVDRHVGFRIEEVHQSPWRRFAGLPSAAPKVTTMDPWLIFAWGPPEALEELLEARVGGESDALRRRSGLEGFTASLDGDDLGAIVDPVAIWQLLEGPDATASTSPHLVDGLDVATVRSRMEGGRERLEVALRLHEAQAAERLALALSNEPYELLSLAPAEAPWVVSVATRRPLATLSALRTLIQRVAAESGAPPVLTALADRLSTIELEALVRLDFELEAAFVGELALMGLPAPGRPTGEGWALLARLNRPERAERALEWLLPFILGGDKAYGKVYDDAGHAIHLVRPAGAAGPGAEMLAWRARGGLLEFAPTAAHLEALHTLWRSERTYGDSEILATALAELPDELAGVALLSPELLAALGGPAVALAAERLSTDSRLALGLRAELPWLRLTSNLGAWTLGAALIAADHEALDRLTLSGLTDECRAAHHAMCLRWPRAVPCRPLALGRGARIQAACDRLEAKRSSEAPAP